MQLAVIRAKSQPCDILCSIDISEKGAKLGSLMVSTGFLNVLKTALSIKCFIHCPTLDMADVIGF